MPPNEKTPAPRTSEVVGIQRGIASIAPPTETDVGLMRRAAGELGREIDCGPETFTYGGRSYGPGKVFIEDPMAADRVEEATDRLFNRSGVRSAAGAAEEARKAVLAGDGSQNYLIPGNLPDGSTSGIVAPGSGPHPLLLENGVVRGQVGYAVRQGESVEATAKRGAEFIKQSDANNEALRKAAEKRETAGKQGDDPTVEDQAEREEAQRKQREAEEKERQRSGAGTPPPPGPRLPPERQQGGRR